MPLAWCEQNSPGSGIAQEGCHAYLNCRRRLKKTNVNAKPVSENRQFPVVHGRNAHGFTGVAGIRARQPHPLM
jgi:hypothetical protein